MSSKRKERWIYFAKVSVYINSILSLGKLLIGIYTLSAFMCVNAFYNAGMAIVKFIVVKGHNEANRIPGDSYSNGYVRIEYTYYRRVGITLAITSTIYIIYCIRLFFYCSNAYYPMALSIAIAAFTFVEIGASIYGVVITRGEKEPVIRALKLSNVSASMISLVLTQTAILSFTKRGDNSVANGLAGLIFGGIAVCIGIYMIIHMSRIMNGKNEKRMIKKVLKYVAKVNSEIKIEPVCYRDLGPDDRTLFVKASNYKYIEEFQCLNQKVKERMNVVLSQVTATSQIYNE